MEAIILPIALATTAACALVNQWLAIRVIRLRFGEKISIGDGGSPRLTARMRAQLNFAEYTPLVLILIALIELAVGTQTWLWIVAGLFVLARILHGIGMDGWMPARQVGTALTFTIMLGLAAVAAAVPFYSFGAVETIEVTETAG